MTRTLRSMLLIGAILTILVWVSGCYLAFLVHDDCIDALNKSAGDGGLYAVVVRKCAGSDDRLQWVSMWGFVISAAVAASLLWLRARFARASLP